MNTKIFDKKNYIDNNLTYLYNTGLYSNYFPMINGKKYKLHKEILEQYTNYFGDKEYHIIRDSKNDIISSEIIEICLLHMYNPDYTWVKDRIFPFDFKFIVNNIKTNLLFKLFEIINLDKNKIKDYIYYINKKVKKNKTTLIYGDFVYLLNSGLYSDYFPIINGKKYKLHYKLMKKLSIFRWNKNKINYTFKFNKNIINNRIIYSHIKEIYSCNANYVFKGNKNENLSKYVLHKKLPIYNLNIKKNIFNDIHSDNNFKKCIKILSNEIESISYENKKDNIENLINIIEKYSIKEYIYKKIFSKSLGRKIILENKNKIIKLFNREINNFINDNLYKYIYLIITEEIKDYFKYKKWSLMVDEQSFIKHKKYFN
jgi:hypothetical protein